MTKKVKKSNKEIKWISREVFVANIAPTPKNYKIRNDLGLERLRASLKSFGLAGTMICNWSGKLGDTTKLVLVDGNYRREEALAKGEKKVWVSLPSRALSASEFKEMSAMYDYAKAGDVDIESINNDLGNTKDFYDKYHMQVPIEHLEKMGKGAKLPDKGLQYSGGKKGEATEEVSDIRMVQLFFNEKQEAEFRKLEDKLRKKYKTQSTTDTVLRAVKQAAK